MTDPALPHRSCEDDPPDDRPSIAELQQFELQGVTEPIVEAAPMLLEIAAAALIRRDTECSCGAELGCFPDCKREIAERSLVAALSKVRP